MPTLTLNYETDSERLLIEAAFAYVSTMRNAAMTAPAGSILRVCEEIAVGKGKEFLRDSLEEVVNGRIEQLDKKGGSRGRARAVRGPVGTRGVTTAM